MRPSRDEYFLGIVAAVAKGSTCLRRSVGCVLVNSRRRVIATGYNGVESGAGHCNFENPPQVAPHLAILMPEYARGQPWVKYPFACEGHNLPSGQGLDKCLAIHAEMNALLDCPNVQEIYTCYVSASPCNVCVKLLLGTSCQRIVFRERYAHDQEASLKWLKSKYNSNNVAREWIHLPGTGQ